MFKVGDKVKYKEKNLIGYLTKDRVYSVISINEALGVIEFINDSGVQDMTFGNKFEKVEDNMEKNLLEIIKDGFNNKVYEDVNGNTVYVASNNEVIFNYKKPKNSSTKIDIEILNLNAIYKLERKQYTFTEAFAAYEEGKEIESCISGKIWGEEIACFNTIAIKDIQGKWYINN